MRLRFGVALLAVLSALPLLGAPAFAADDEFVVDGGGWGHGVGMSQFGAYGMAIDPEGQRTAEDIIAHFYSGATTTDATTLASVPAWIFEDEALAVNVASKRDILDFEVVAGSITVCQRGDGENADECDPDTPDATLSQGMVLRVEFDDESGGCRRSTLDIHGDLVSGGEALGDCRVDIDWNDHFEDLQATNLIGVEELIYARGPMQLRPNDNGSTFDVTVRLGLEEYLLGLAEMPLGWPYEALRAQAIAGRSYAIRTVAANGGSDGSGRNSDCGCHIRRTPADQNYDAWINESADFTGNWRLAVEDSAGKVVVHPELEGIATTYYSSSTGGATENVEYVWGGDPQPHLKSVADPWGGNPDLNPLATWRVTIPEPVVRAELCELGHCWEKVSGSVMVAQPPGASIRFQGLVGREVRSAEVPAVWLYNILNARDLRVSPYITGVLAPSPFVDIDTSVHRNDIIYIADFGVTKGCNPPDNTLYCPANPVTRQQMASFLIRALELPAATVDHFGDDGDSVHQADINALAEAGITRGCNPPDNTLFCPERPVTRGEMAAFLVRAYGYVDDGGGDHFTDDDASVFQGDIDRLATAGVTRGCNPPDNTRFCPSESVTREQMASFLARAMRGAVGG